MVSRSVHDLEWGGVDAMHPNEGLLRREYEARARRDDPALSELLSEGIIWHVPGLSAIAGVYRGRDQVMEYVRRRRELADDTFEISVEDVLANDRHGLVIASGKASREGKQLEWRAHGLYRFEGGRIAECWVLPEDQDVFDAAWS
jgi:ketosteroid isomerase-like protein